jgi:tripartite-type tricarboxylate transporter receptor subunit TctC
MVHGAARHGAARHGAARHGAARECVELGVRGVEFDQWFAVFAPARLPEALTRRLNEEVIKAVRHPELVAAIDRLGAEVITSSPEGLARLIAQDTVRYGEIVRRIGAKLD